MGLRAGYKETDVGPLPREWAVKPLGNLFSFKNGVNADKRAYGVGVRFVNVLETISHSHLMPGDVAGRVALPDAAIAVYSVRRGDVLFNRTSETEADLALAATYIGSERVVFGGFVIRGRPTTSELDPDYSGYALRSQMLRAQIVPLGQGAIRANIGQESLARVLTPVPQLEEQRAIASALSDVDALIAGLERLIAKKRDTKQAAMQQLLIGQTRLPGFSGEWERLQLGQVGTCLRGVTYQAEGDLFPYDSTETKRLLRSNNVQDAAIVTNDVQFVAAARVKEQQLLRAGDVLICMANGSKTLVGKAGRFDIQDGFDYTFGAFMGAFRGNGQADQKFIFYLFQTGRYRDYINNLLAGSSINNLAPSSVESLEFVVPPQAEQTAIAAVLSDMDTDLSALESRLAKTRAIKQGMMQELLTGRTRLI